MLKLNNCKKFMKKCTKCNKLKNINEFTIKKDMKDGHRNQCKECCNKRYKKKKQPFLYLNGVKCLKFMKICSKCGKLKMISKFSKEKKARDGHRNDCNDCKYKNNKNRNKLICKECGKEFYSQDKSQKFCSSICYGKNHRGENSPSWNPNLTNEERENYKVKGRSYFEYKTWRKIIYERDNYYCQCCGKKGKGDLVAHHLDNYYEFKNKRTDVNNGVTLCIKCHKQFHHIYGVKHNTKEQFKEFINNITKTA